MNKTNFLLSILLLLLTFSATAQKSFEVEKNGKGQPILLLPGFTCTPAVYDSLIDELGNNHEVHAFTFAGFGGLPPISFPWLPQIKADIENYVIENNLYRPIIIGHSLGGTLGLWLTSESDVYSKLIIIDALPAMGALMMADYDSENISYDNPYNDQILAMTDEDFNNMAVQSASYMTKNTDKQKVIANWILTSDRKTYVYGYTDLLKLDLREKLRNIKTPVYILAATEPFGKEAVEVNYKKQYQNLKEYSIKFAEGSGHFIMFDQPEWLKTHIQTALDSNE